MSNEHTRLPDFLIIGAMKCATSTLHDQLAMQPGISMSDPKEPNFFSDGPNFAKGMDWYRSLFADMPAGDLKGESSTHMTKYPVHPNAPENLHAAIPDVKLIYVMRDPIDRIISQYIHEWSEHTISTDINQAIREHSRLIAYSSYAMQIQKYADRFGRASILPVFFERLMSEPQAELERICRYIGYEGDPVWRTDQEAQNTSGQRQRRHPAINALLNVRIVQIARRTLMPSGMRDRIKSRWTMKQRPELSAESLAYLREQVDADLTVLGDMIGRGISCARFKEAVREGGPPEWADGEVCG